MPPKRRRGATQKDKEDEEDSDASPSKRSAGRSRSREKAERIGGTECDDNDEEEDGGGHTVGMRFSQVAPESSQPPCVRAKPSEEANLNGLNPTTRAKIVLDVSRLLLFKALAGEPIDRRKVLTEAFRFGEHKNTRMSNAVFTEAEGRLRDVFGFELRRVPAYMEHHLPTKFNDRFYVVNEVGDDAVGTHSKAIHSVHIGSAIERGLLMMILAFVYCRGEPRDNSRWITAHNLYRLLNGVDEHILPNPPPLTGTRGGVDSISTGRFDQELSTPDVTALIEKFVYMDYLLEHREDKNKGASTSAGTAGDEMNVIVMYAMGPRAAMEIGRRQLIYFCAEILDEEPDPTMLAELGDCNDEEQEAKGHDDENETFTPDD